MVNRPSPSRDRILRFLLGHASSQFRKNALHADLTGSLYDLAAKTGVAFSWVHATLRELENAHWVQPGTLHVTQPTEIYQWWREHRTKPKIHGFQVADMRGTARALTKRGIPNAITTYVAENAYQSHLFPRRLDTYVRNEHLVKARHILVHELDAQIGGVNFRLFTGDDNVVDEVRLEGPPWRDYAPFPQVILDLFDERGSPAEAAELLISKAYPYAHPSLP